MIHPKNPPRKEVLDSLKDLPTSGTVAQQQDGMLFLDLNDEWIFRALTVLHDYGYIIPPFFVYPPCPAGAHIEIVKKSEAEDYELFGEKKRVVSRLIGKTVNFEVVTAHVSHPRIKKYGVEARYKIRVTSKKLSKIRKDLTGLSTGPINGHFVIIVGIRNPKLIEEMNKERKLSPYEKYGVLDDEEDGINEDSNELDMTLRGAFSPVELPQITTNVYDDKQAETKFSPDEKHEEFVDDNDINDDTTVPLND